MKRWFYLLIITGAFLLAACGGGREVSGKLTIGIMPDVDSIPFIVAQEKGFFKEQGVTVELVPFKSALDRDSAMQSGKLDGAVSDVLAAAFARDGGFAAAIGSLTAGSYKLVVGRNEPANSVKDLKDKEIGLSKNTIIEYLTDRMLTENGLTPGDIRKVVIPQIPARMEMLNNGRIAAAVLPDPLAAVAVRSGAKVLASSEQMGIDIGVMIFTSRAANQKMEEMQALYRAYDKAVAYIAVHPVDSYLDMLINKGSFPESVRGALILPAYKKAGPPARKDVDDVVKWLYDKKLIKKVYNLEELVDSKFVRR